MVCARSAEILISAHEYLMKHGAGSLDLCSSRCLSLLWPLWRERFCGAAIELTPQEMSGFAGDEQVT